MNLNLVETAKGLITPALVEEASNQLDEVPDNTWSALRSAIPASFAAMTGAAATEGGARRLLESVTQSHGSGVVSRLTGAAALDLGGSAGHGRNLMSDILGSDRSSAVAEVISRSSGVRATSASELTAVAFALVSGLVGRACVESRLGPGGLSRLLLSHKRAILDDPDTPAGLGAALGVGDLSQIGGGYDVASVPGHEVREARRRGLFRSPRERSLLEPGPREEAVAVSARRAGIAKWLLVGAALVAGFFLLTRARGPELTRSAAPGAYGGPSAAGEASEQAATQPKLETPERSDLAPGPAGAESTAAAENPSAEPQSTEAPSAQPPSLTSAEVTVSENDKLPTSGADFGNYVAGSAPVPHAFAFEDLTFEDNKSTLTDKGMSAVKDIADVLAAHPSARVRIEGYTDGRGDPDVNRFLSTDRAEAVKKALIERGIAADRIDTQSYGPDKPVAADNGQGGPEKNRRTEITLLSR